MAKKKEITTKTPHCCEECVHGNLIRYSLQNPVLAQCKRKLELMVSQDGRCSYEHPVMVATSKHCCAFFEVHKGKKTVKLIERRAV